MSLDTRDKRMSMIGLASPFVRLFKDPSGTIDAAARAMLLFLYSGIGAAPPPVLEADASNTFHIDADTDFIVGATDLSGWSAP